TRRPHERAGLRSGTRLASARPTTNWRIDRSRRSLTNADRTPALGGPALRDRHAPLRHEAAAQPPRPPSADPDPAVGNPVPAVHRGVGRVARRAADRGRARAARGGITEIAILRLSTQGARRALGAALAFGLSRPIRRRGPLRGVRESGARA